MPAPSHPNTSCCFHLTRYAGRVQRETGHGRKMLGEEQTLFNFLRAVLPLGSVDIAGLSVPLPGEKSCI